MESGSSSLSRSLSRRTADFLKLYPPYSYLENDTLLDLAQNVRIKYFGPGEYIFKEEDPAGNQAFILHKGRVEFIRNLGEENRLIDVCDVGDTFGMRSLISGNPYVVTARAAEEALLYLIDGDIFRPLLEEYPRVALYFASGFAAGQPVVRSQVHNLRNTRQALLFQESDPILFRDEDVIIMKPTEQVISCSVQNSIREAAQMMTDHTIGSIVILNEQKHPVGIAAHSDFTRKVSTGIHKIDDPITLIMSSPVITTSLGITVAEAILLMMRHKVRHLVVTEDGSPDSAIAGIISEHDILLSQGNNPAIIVKQMLKAKDKETLRDIRDRGSELVHAYLSQELSLPFITATITEINDALITRAIELSLDQLDAEGMIRPEQKFCWLSMGSEGRGEQLLRTDQDNALIYEEPEIGQASYVQSYFLRLGELVTEILEEAGFEHCPGEIMASNAAWNLPLSGWKEQFSKWIHSPNPRSMMNSTIFFDMRVTYGDQALIKRLFEHWREEIRRTPNFLSFLAHHALGNPPPLSFFKNFIVERGGSHKDEFDIKLRGMMPLSDAARVLSLSNDILGVTNTMKRYERLSELEPKQKELYDAASMAYELMIRHRALSGFANGDSGRYLRPQSLNQLERQTLKYAFRTIEDLQSLLRMRFNLNYFR